MLPTLAGKYGNTNNHSEILVWAGLSTDDVVEAAGSALDTGSS